MRSLCGILIGVLWGTSACQGSLQRMAARGDHAGVIAEAEGRRRAPKGRDARVYARALAAQGAFERARDVLYEDYRGGGDVRSLVALADVEHAHERLSPAVLHYARTFDLQPTALRGRSDVCAYFEARAAALVRSGEGRAAERFLERSEQLCPNRPPAEAEAHAKLRELIETVAALEVTGEIQRARAEPASMEVGLPDPQAILDFVLAAGRGEHGIDLLPDHQLRAELAGVTWSELAPLVMARSEPEQAYLQLRLAPVLPDVPQTPAPRRGVSEANLWIATALEWPEGSAWRLFGWLGDLSSAELALRSQLEPPAAPGTEDQPSASAPGHWSARVAGADPELGVVARLRAASGKRSLSLELWRAHAAVPARRAWVEDEIVRALAWGRPWHALAILDALPEAPQGALTEAVDAVLAVAEAVCGKPCDDPQDLDVVVEVMGSAWVDAQAQRIRGRVDLHVDVPSTIGCDVASTMTRSILDKAWRAPGGAVSAQEIVTGLESELVWECAGQWLLPLLAATTEPPHHAVARFIDLVAISTPLEAGSELSVAGRVAVWARDHDRAEALLDRAAAQAAVPEVVWLDAVVMARASAMLDLERLALHRIALDAGDATQRWAQRELLVHAVRDLHRSWAERETSHGAEAVARQIDETIGTIAPRQRDAFRTGLIARLTRQAVREQWPQESLAGLGLEMPPANAEPSPWDDAALTQAVREGRLARLPSATEALADPRAFEDVRLALAETARDWSIRRRMALGLVAVGSATARAQGLAVLRTLAGAEGAPRVDAVLLSGAVGLVPGVMPLKTVPWVEDPAWRARLVFGLDLEPALVAR